MKNIFILAIAVCMITSCSHKSSTTAVPTPSNASKFIGAWGVNEKGSKSPAAQYPISIARTGDGAIAVINFNDFFTTPIRITLLSDSTFFIPSQMVQSKQIYGQGIASNFIDGEYNTISMSYAVVDSATGNIDDYGYINPSLSSPSIWNR